MRTRSSSDCSVPEAVIIPAGQNSAVFDITIPDNAVLGGNQEVSIAVSAPDHIGTREFLVVRDDETAVITLVLPDTVREGDGLLRGAGRVV